MFSKHFIFRKKSNKFLKLLGLLLTVYTTAVLGTAVFNLYQIKTEKLDFGEVNFQAIKKPTIVCENFLDGSLNPISEIQDSVQDNVDSYAKDKIDNSVESQADESILQLKCDYNMPIAVMIDNEISAPAPAGLAEAKIVFEALVEGGVTRYLAFFDSNEAAEKIGPVRSTRPYFLDWAEGQRSFLVHSGGSPEALRQISANRSGLIDLDEIGADGVYFFRDPARSAPHNLYTSSVLLKTALEIKYNLFKKTSFWTKAALVDFYQENKWLYQNDDRQNRNQPPESGLQSKPITINFSTFGYKVKYEYNPADNNYLRYLADKIQLTESNKSIRVKNIIIIWLKTYLVDELRLGMQNSGAGQALVCRNGACVDGQWRQEKPDGRIQFFDSADQKIALTRGNVWIEVLPEGREAEY